MSLSDIPDPENDEALTGWFDAQIASPQLRELAADLAAVTNSRNDFDIPERDEMVSWLGDSLDGVLDRGTSALTADQIDELYSNARLMYGLQSLVFAEGGRYWSDLADKAYSESYRADRDRFERLEAAAARDVTADPASSAEAIAAPPAPPAVAARPSQPPVKASPLPRYLAALAAGIAVAIGVWSFNRPAAPWGWNAAGALAEASDPAAYLEQLATSAGEWQATRPTNEAQLEKRLREFLAGCDRLIAGPHRTLAPDDRDWLVTKCRAWREKIVGHLDTLATAHDVAGVRSAADDTVEKLVKALRSRATEIRERTVPAV